MWCRCAEEGSGRRRRRRRSARWESERGAIGRKRAQDQRRSLPRHRRPPARHRVSVVLLWRRADPPRASLAADDVTAHPFANPRECKSAAALGPSPLLVDTRDACDLTAAQWFQVGVFFVLCLHNVALQMYVRLDISALDPALAFSYLCVSVRGLGGLCSTGKGRTSCFRVYAIFGCRRHAWGIGIVPDLTRRLSWDWDISRSGVRTLCSTDGSRLQTAKSLKQRIIMRVLNFSKTSTFNKNLYEIFTLFATGLS